MAYVDAQIPAEAYVHVEPPPVPCVPGPVYAAAPAPVAAHAAYFTTCARVIDFTN